MKWYENVARLCRALKPAAGRAAVKSEEDRISRHPAVVSEWLRSWTRNPMGSPRTGSNPVGCDTFLQNCVKMYPECPEDTWGGGIRVIWPSIASLKPVGHQRRLQCCRTPRHLHFPAAILTTADRGHSERPRWGWLRKLIKDTKPRFYSTFIYTWSLIWLNEPPFTF